MTEVRQKEIEKVVHFDVSPTEGINFLMNDAQEIQSHCTDHSISEVDITRLAVFFESGLFVAKFKDDEGNFYAKSMTSHSMGQLCGKLGVPARYIEKCALNGHVDLAQDNLNTWICNFDKDLFLRAYKDKIRGVLSSRYSVLDTPEILEVLNSSTRGLDLKVKEYFMSPERFHLRLVQQEKMKILGEDLFAGIQVDSSDVGRSTLTVNFFIYKQICTNGLCITKGAGNLFTQKHISISSEDFKEQLVASLKGVPMLIDEYTHTIQRCSIQNNILGGKKIPKEGDLLNDLIQKIRYRTGIPEAGAVKVIDLARDKYGSSDWGVINAITEVAQDYTLEKRIELERAAGSMLKVS